MLSWSGAEAGDTIDLSLVAGRGDSIGVTHGVALVRFAAACAGDDDGVLATARDILVDETDPDFMVDAAAVAANFEMMTRLSDATGATMPPETIERRAPAIGAMGVSDLVSRR